MAYKFQGYTSGYTSQIYKAGGYGAKTTSQYFEPKTLEDYETLAEQYGIKKKPSLIKSVFTKTLDLFQRMNYASAGAAKALLKPELGENPLKEAWKGLIGKEKETYSDVLREVGVENKYVRGIVGFALDVALDPFTYVGGAIFKTTGKVIKGTAKLGAKGLAKVAPKTYARLAFTGNTLKDALGEAFVHGYKVTGGVVDNVGIAMNKMGIVKTDIVENFTKSFGKKFNKYTNNEIIKAGDILMKNRVLEKSVKRGAKGIKYLTSDSKKINTIIKKLKSHGASIAKKTDLPLEKIYENYFPAILKKTPSKGVTKSLTKLQEGGTKEWRNKLKIGDDALNNPIEALARRDYEITSNVIKRETLNELIEGFGTKSVKEAARKGMLPVAIGKGFKKTKTGQVAIQEILGYLKPRDLKFVNGQLYPDMKTIDVLARASGFDGFTNKFKELVTAWFPAFHVRNMGSGYVQNYEELGSAVFRLDNLTGGFKTMAKSNDILKTKGFTGSFKEFYRKIIERFGRASRYVSDLGDEVTEMVDGSIKLKGLNIGRKAGNFIETQQKAHATITALRKGFSLDEAFKLAERAGFDYSKITKFEASVMKRLIPFYTFARKNAVLQTTTLVKHPERILNQLKFTNSLSEIFGGSKPTEEDLKGIPPWAQQGLGFKISEGSIVSSFDLPIQEFMERVTDPIRTSLMSLNPLIKYPVEAKTGFDFFRQKQIVDLKSIKEPTAKLLMDDRMPKIIKDVFNVKSYEGKDGKTYYKADSGALHLLRNLPTSRFQSSLDRAFGNDVETIDKILSLLTGARIYDIDKNLQESFTERDLIEAYQKELEELGEGFSYSKFLTPR